LIVQGGIQQRDGKKTTIKEITLSLLPLIQYNGIRPKK
jgi:hypothetical protein